MRLRRSFPLSCLALLALGFSAPGGGAQSGSPPTFVPGDVGDLQCTVVLKPRKDERDFLVVEVANKSRTSAEPLGFDILIDVPPDPAGRFRELRQDRVGQRAWGRGGRAIGPRGSLRYWLPLPWGRRTPLDKVRVRVRRASFFRGRGVAKAPVKVVRLEEYETHDDYLKRKVSKTRITLRNLVDHPVDAILRAEPKGPGDPTLLHVFLEPGETRTVDENTRAASIIDATSIYHSGRWRHESVEVLDWSVLFDTGQRRMAMQILEPAWRGLYRWPLAKETVVEGRVEFEIQHQASGALAKGEAGFRLSGSEGSGVDANPPLSPELRRQLLEDIGASLAPFRFASFEELAEQADPYLLDLAGDGTATIYLRSKRPQHSVLRWPIVFVKEQRVIGGAEVGLQLHQEASFTTATVPDGRYTFTAVERRSVNLPVGITLLEERTQQLQRNPSPVHPSEVKRRTYDMLSGSQVSATFLRFTALAFRGPREQDAPSGDGIAELRKAWEEPYRYPAGEHDLAGSARIRAPQTGASWMNETEVTGRIRIEGWRGRVSPEEPTPYASMEFSPRGEISPEGKKQIASLLPARFSIWTRQDFCARRYFDTEFRGCSIHRGGEEGLLRVEGHPRIATVRIEKGLPLEVGYTDGTAHRRRFEKVRGQLVPTRTVLVYGDREALAQVVFRPVSGAMLFPVRIEIRDWFERGWGPELFEFKLKER